MIPLWNPSVIVPWAPSLIAPRSPLGTFLWGRVGLLLDHCQGGQELAQGSGGQGAHPQASRGRLAGVFAGVLAVACPKLYHSLQGERGRG